MSQISKPQNIMELHHRRLTWATTELSSPANPLKTSVDTGSTVRKKIRTLELRSTKFGHELLLTESNGITKYLAKVVYVFTQHEENTRVIAQTEQGEYNAVTLFYNNKPRAFSVH